MYFDYFNLIIYRIILTLFFINQHDQRDGHWNTGDVVAAPGQWNREVPPAVVNNNVQVWPGHDNRINQQQDAWARDTGRIEDMQGTWAPPPQAPTQPPPQYPVIRDEPMPSNSGNYCFLL